MSDPALRILRTVFGYDAFRGAQAEIVAHVAGGGDALVLMPTGGGKSLCYQIPALLRPGVAIVVSPLIALMQDQVSALKEVGAAADFLNSSLSFERAMEIERAMLAGGAAPIPPTNPAGYFRDDHQAAADVQAQASSAKAACHRGISL